MNSPAEIDIGPLSWVKGEIDLALERTAAEITACAKADAASSAEAIKKARSNLHQAHGALAIVGLDGLTEFADAIKQLLAFMAEEANADAAIRGPAVAATLNGVSALRIYLDDLMAGHPNLPLKLLPAYQEMAKARGLPLPGPGELFFPDLTQRPPKRERDVSPLAPEALTTRLKAARLGFERGLLKWIKGDAKGIAEMKASVAMIEMTRVTPAARAYWWICLGVLEALAAGGLPDPVGAKRFAMRLGAQIKKLVDGDTEIPDIQLREALYQAASANGGGESLAIVRAAYRLEGMVPSGEPSDAERLLPLIRRLRDLIASAKEDWNRLSAGTAAALPPFHERVAKIAAEGAATGHAPYARLTAAILAETDLLRRDPTRHNEVLALEMATALLLAESALERFDALDENFAAQAEALADRLDALGRGEQLGVLDMPHLDAISRRAQERLLLESVAREIRTNLGAIEQTLDAFFRDPARQTTLAALKQPIRQVEGALAVLGEERANAVLWECSKAIEEFSQPGFTPVAGEFEDLAKKFSALGFFVEQLQHGPADIDSILEPKLAKPAPVEEVEPAALAPVVEAPPVATVASATVTAADDSHHEAAIAATSAALAKEALPEFEVPPPPPPVMAIEAPPPSAAATRLVDASTEELDAELLGIFLEEAREVLETIADHLPRVHQAPDDQSNLTTLRRSFHTLKGSGRMVGLNDLGEVGWAVEQVMNRWLHEALPASPALQKMLDLAYETFAAWVTQLESGGSTFFDAADLERACDALHIDEKAEQAKKDAEAAEAAEAAEIAAMEAEAEAAAAEDAAKVAAAAEKLAAEASAKSAAAIAEAAEAAKEQPVMVEAPEIDLGLEAEAQTEIDAEVEAESTAEPSQATADAAADEEGDAAPAIPDAAPVHTAEVVNFPDPPPVRVGDVDIPAVLFNLYLDESRGHVATLQATLGLEVVPENNAIRAAHTTASISAATGITPISTLAHALELALVRLAQVAAAPTDAQRFVFARCAGALEGMLGAVAERRMPGSEAALTAELDAMMPAPALKPSAEVPNEVPNEVPDEVPAEAPAAAAPVVAEVSVVAVEEPVAPPEPAAGPEVNLLPQERRTQRIRDEIDFQLLPLFLEESVDLMGNIGEALRAWRTKPDDVGIADRLKRALHTLKGSARMAGAMACGELLHSMETRIEQAAALRSVQPDTIDGLETSYDRASMMIEHLRDPDAPVLDDLEDETEPAASSAPAAVASVGEDSLAPPAAVEITKPVEPTINPAAAAPAASANPAVAPTIPAAPAAASPVPASKPAVSAPSTAPAPAAAPAAAIGQFHLRVRAELVDQLVNEAGEVAIARARIEGEMRSLKASLLDLTENVIRLRNQLRDVEIHAESQMQSQKALITETGDKFDPLEFDRFTRFQEMTRMMAESVNDVATVQHGLLRNLDYANAALAAQARLNRELSQRLMSVRMVPFDSIAERLHRVVRQAAKDAGKRANLDIRQGQTSIDRSVLDKMAGPIEHLLRNSVGHGLEDRTQRIAAGKEEIGQVVVALAQEGNEIVLAISDDGAGLDFEKIRALGVARGLIAADATLDQAEISQLIFQSGFSTAKEVTALSGRGVGMDVVKSETSSLGGRIEVNSTPGKGSTFRIYLPLTLAVTQVVLVSAGNQQFAIPSSMVEQASELKPEAIAAIRAAGGTDWLGTRYPWHYLPQLLGEDRAPVPARRHWLILVKGGSERVALEIDALSGNQEIVVKTIGQQLARVPGLAGATVLGDGEIVLILNPIALLVGAAKRNRALAAQQELHQEAHQEVVAAAPEEAAPAAATVMVVDDSLTVRKISGRLLARQGYQVLTAKDGVDALEQLTEVMPDVMLVDIEMPRMDGFDLARNIRADARLKHIPIIMITSRTADKHRNHALEIGVNAYMGKPYDESELLDQITQLIKEKA